MSEVKRITTMYNDDDNEMFDFLWWKSTRDMTIALVIKVEVV